MGIGDGIFACVMKERGLCKRMKCKSYFQKDCGVGCLRFINGSTQRETFCPAIFERGNPLRKFCSRNLLSNELADGQSVRMIHAPFPYTLGIQ